MSKRGGFPGMGGFGGMNLNQLMKEAKKMQADMEKSQEELGEKEFTASAGGEAIVVKVSGKKEIKELNKLYENNSAELVAIFGRLRVGKTYLVDEVFSDRITN